MLIAAKILFSAFLLLLLGWRIDWASLRDGLAHLAWWALPVALALQLAALALGTVRWHGLLKAHDLDYRFSWLFKPYLIGAWLNNFLPSSTGGDIARIYYLHRRGHRADISISPVVTERLVGFFVLMGLGSLALYLGDATSPVLLTLRPAVLAAFLVLGAGMGIAAWGRSYDLVERLFSPWRKHRIVDALLRIAESSHGHLNRAGIVVPLILLSVVIQGVEVVLFWLLGVGIGAPDSILTYASVIPPVLAAAGMPLSVGGLGVREMTAVSLFVSAGMAETHAATVTLLYIPVLYLSALPGLYFLLSLKDHAALTKWTDKALAEGEG